MRKRICLLIGGVLLVCSGVVSGEPVDDEGFLVHWLVCGPFPNLGPMGTEKDHATTKVYPGWEKDWLVEQGGEEKIEPSEGLNYRVVFPDCSFWKYQPDGVTIQWRGYVSDSNKIDLLKVFSNKELNIDDTKEHLVRFVAGYAYCVVNSPDDREAILSFGSDDGYKIWLNHHLVAAANVQRGIKIDENKFPVSLKKGRNPLLVKVYQNTGGYGFVLRFISRNVGAWMDDLNITRH